MKCAHEAKLGVLYSLLLSNASDIDYPPGAVSEPLARFFREAVDLLRNAADAVRMVGEIHRLVVHHNEDGHAAESALFSDELVQLVFATINEYLVKNGSALPPADPKSIN